MDHWAWATSGDGDHHGSPASRTRTDPDHGQTEIDDEARKRLTPLLTAHKLIGWTGPGGWERSTTNLGRTEPLDGPPPGPQAPDVPARQRRVLL